jgi:hypothetical protein
MGQDKSRVAWLTHPLVGSVLSPILLAIVFGALTVWAAQASALLRISNVEAAVESNKQESAKQISEIKSESIPRREHDAHWKAIDDKLSIIQQQQQQTSNRVDDIFKLLTDGKR